MDEEIIKKFAKLKYAKSINLVDAEQDMRYGIKGRATGVFGNCWFCLPKGKALFKVFHWPVYSDISFNLSMINELLCYQLARQIDMPCADYEIAYYGDYSGVVSYSLIQDGEKFENYMRHTFTDLLKALEKNKAEGCQIDDTSIKQQVFKSIVFQLLTLQSDGKPDCYVFASSDDGKKLRYAGLVDNELAFNVAIYERRAPIGDVFGLFGEGGHTNVLDLIENYNARITTKCIAVRDVDVGKYGYFARVQEICDYAKENPWAMEVLKSILAELDTDKAFESMEGEHHVEVDESYKTYVRDIVEYGRAEFQKELGLNCSSELV